MPTYLTPGVYVEEVPAATKPIEGVATSVAAFVGLAPYGPTNEPVQIANWSQFERTFSHPDRPQDGPFMSGAYLAHSVYGWFQQGGGLCWVVRVGKNGDASPGPAGAAAGGGARPGGRAAHRRRRRRGRRADPRRDHRRAAIDADGRRRRERGWRRRGNPATTAARANVPGARRAGVDPRGVRRPHAEKGQVEHRDKGHPGVEAHPRRRHRRRCAAARRRSLHARATARDGTGDLTAGLRGRRRTSPGARRTRRRRRRDDGCCAGPRIAPGRR